MITLYEKSEDFILNLKNELQPVINEVRDWKQFFFSTKKTYILSRLSVFLSLVLWYNIVEVFFKGESFMKDIYAVLDIGSATVKLLVGEVVSANINILFSKDVYKRQVYG